MKQNKIYLLIIFLFMVSAAKAIDIISVAELAKNLKNKDFVIVCATEKNAYRVHITGAINVPHTALYNNEPFRALVKSPAEMAKMLGSKGISPDKTIVVYDEGSGKYSGRMYWMLKYLGATNVKMLDGNLKTWKFKRKPITGAPTKLKPATFAANVDESQLAKISDVKNAIGNSDVVLVDARTPEEFDGTADTELRPGHIPGAVNVNYETVLNAKGQLKSDAELKSLFESKGITPDKTAIVYCETSIRAGVVYLALKGLGYPNVKVYDGAYLEWQATASNKVE